jgi:hypothetical protein
MLYFLTKSNEINFLFITEYKHLTNADIYKVTPTSTLIDLLARDMIQWESAVGRYNERQESMDVVAGPMACKSAVWSVPFYNRSIQEFGTGALETRRL